MSDILHISAIQTSLKWEDKQGNLSNFEKLISQVPDTTDVIVLPEMFTTGFTMNPKEVAETMKEDTIQWMQELAKEKDAALMGSFVAIEKGHYFNRCVFLTPEGEVLRYDKRHTFTLAGEHEVYTKGSERLIVNYKGWKICPLICYDLRFPVWSRNVENYDLLIYMANWPKPRIHAWDVLLKARAVENMAYTVGVNRIGHDENNYEYSGHSAIIDTLGEVLVDLPENSEGILTAVLKKSDQDRLREKLNFLQDKDRFMIQDG